jgi:hypothetical protein
VRLNGTALTSPAYVDAMAPDDGSTIVYSVTAVDVNDNESGHSSGVSPVTTVSAVTWSLLPPYPNPSTLDQSTTLPLVIGSDVSGDVTVEIRDAGGRLVRRIVISSPLPGPTQVVWDGKNDAGRPTVPGVYRASIVQGDAHAGVRFVRRP